MTPGQIILAFETSCDETAVAASSWAGITVQRSRSQVAEHEIRRVVPEIASRNHLVQAPRLLEHALAKAGCKPLDAFAATTGPGLASSLMIGRRLRRDWPLRLINLPGNQSRSHLLRHF
jgi:N6-L-threonylcarbamoyladenine synthase